MRDNKKWRSALAVLGVAVLCCQGGIASAQSTDVASSLSGYVFVDIDIDFTYDPLTDWLLQDIEIQLYKDGVLYDTAYSGSKGKYEFTDLEPGTYNIRQTAIPPGYLTVQPEVGELNDYGGSPVSTYPGNVIMYNQAAGVLPQIDHIVLDDPTVGTGYNFGQIWFGKAWYLTGGNPPEVIPGNVLPPVPEPTAIVLAGLGTVVLSARRKRRRG